MQQAPVLRDAADATLTHGAPDLDSLDWLLERPVEVPPELFEAFQHTALAGGEDSFNDLGRHFPRDNTNRVANNEELIARVNDYAYRAPTSSKVGFAVWTAASLGGYAARQTKTVPAGCFGHYVSAGRHRLKPAGRHTLKNTRAHWLEDEPVNDPARLIREFGVKTLVVVPENHVAGAFRIGRRGQRPSPGGGEEPEEAEEGAADGEFVLLGQGRHVLDSSCYRDIAIEKLEADRVRVGPVTVLYIKEGELGGAYERNTGVFRVLPPGPPYLLHEKDYEGIELAARTLKPFHLGPITFVTVKEGEMAGAYHKATGLYQLLPPGHTFRLHKKDYEEIKLVQRSNLFQLGPFTFLTVQLGQLAGAYRKKGGDFVLLPPGRSYQLNEDEFEEPHVVKRDRHVVQCGPLTFLTLQEGVLTGAYRTKDGHFEEFAADEEGAEFMLHERDYHGLKVVEKYSTEVQDFGPNKIVTIPGGRCGVFMREGALEIKEPGFYKVPAEYQILESIPLQINSERFEGLELRTKDSVPMRVSFVTVWQVHNPLMVAKWPGTWEELRDCLRSKATSAAVMLLRRFSRAELLPTRQDVLLDTSGAEDADADAVEEAVRRAAEASERAQLSTENGALELLNSASADGGWGLEVLSVKLDCLQLADEKIIADMQLIAQSQLASKRKQMEGRLAAVSAEVEREAVMQKAQASAGVQQTKAESDARAQLAAAKAQNEIALMQATNDARAQAEAKKIDLDMQRQFAESQAAIEETKIRARQREAEAEAAAVRAMAEASYQKGCWEQEVAAKMPPQELELKRLELVVEGVRHFGQAAWRHPDEMHVFLDQLKPFLRLAPGLTAGHLHDAAKGA